MDRPRPGGQGPAMALITPGICIWVLTHSFIPWSQLYSALTRWKSSYGFWGGVWSYDVRPHASTPSSEGVFVPGMTESSESAPPSSEGVFVTGMAESVETTGAIPAAGDECRLGSAP